MGVLAWLSFAPASQLPAVTWIASPDKWAHAAVYLILAGLLGQALRSPNGAFGMAVAYGVLMEIMQFVCFPGRYFEMWDIVANIVGALCAWIWMKLDY